MPSGAKKRKAAKKKQEQASSTLKSNNHESRSQDERESDDGVSSQGSYKKAGHDHGKSSSSSSSSSSSNSSSDDESREVEKKDDNVTVISVPDQPIPIAGDAPFMGSTANVIVESCGLMDSAMPSDPNTEKMIEIAPVDAIISNEPVDNSLPKPNEITPEVSLASDEVKQASSSATDSYVKENEGKTSTVPESNKESEVVISHEEEAPMRPTHGVAQRSSWLSCCGLFDVVTGSSR